MYTGLDLSLTGTGLANISSRGQVVYELFGTKKQDYKHAWDRIESIVNNVNDFLSKTNTKYVLIEDYVISPRNSKTTIQLVELGAAVRYALYKDGIAFITVTPPVLKKYATGSGNAKKNIVIKELYKNHKIDVDDDNVADAIYLAMLCKQLKLKKQPKQKYIKDLLAKIDKEREKVNWK